MDAKTASLKGDLNEEIYMEQLEGFLAPDQKRKVCKLVKSLDGLQQAPKQWHEKFDKILRRFESWPSNEIWVQDWCSKNAIMASHPHVYLVVTGSRYRDLGPQVISLGSMNPSELRIFYSAIGIFVNPMLRPQGLDLRLMDT
ncbi:hypothetical protein RJ639_029642 [Escallonia herrerae]|uniref:Reverse transcriptase Ty1/copia-type domain-containing protein n=1 Tax=Escallonia herrerae TaxID=1293975 RepID=A0AA88X1J6_9ASTE|nr:hypothetical protein RJ639_029642 [Escallonia herrerae]